jgi:phosphoribosylaminoimidazole-succinocarboxamide synthase
MNKGRLLYEGKAKKIYEIPNEKNSIWVEYKDDLTAFNAQKKGSFSGKGRINARITSLIYRYLNSRGVKTHLISEPSDHEMICQRLEIIPLEVVTRNRLAGSTAKKFGLEEGTPLSKPLVEFYYKNDALNDPFISDDQALMMKAAKDQVELNHLKTMALQINSELIQFFKAVGLELIDFKLEFGRTPSGEILLGDEVSPDTCRLWDVKTQAKMDKDVFRRDLGDVQNTYENVLGRLTEKWSHL